ncbi:MAG: hypothetical protein R3242_07775 [Akkermansiaceae bacterium]|nr:hypothetical protein [Akkermansiaceae bacterium]
MIPNEPHPPKDEPEDASEEPQADDWADLDPSGGEYLPADPPAAEAQTTPGDLPDAAPEPVEAREPEGEADAPDAQEVVAEEPPADSEAADTPSREEIRARRMRPSVDVLPDAETLFEKGSRPGPVDIESKEWSGPRPVGFKWIALAGGAIIAMLIICMVILHLRGRNDRAAAIANQTDVQTEARDERDEELENLAKRKLEAIDLFAEFATAKLVEEILPLISNSSDLEPLVRRTGHEPVADKDWEPSEHSKWFVVNSRQGVFAILQGELPDYSRFRAYFMLEQGQLVMDWKATTGYSTASFEQLMEGRGDGSEIRGILRPSALYVGPYEEMKYDCYQLESPNGLDLIWCYAESGTDTERILSAKFRRGSIIEDEEGAWLITLKLKRGPEGALKNQWLIDELLHGEWIDM